MKTITSLKKFFLFLSLFFSISTSLIAQRASFNGSDIPPNGQLRVLMIFIQINYDQNTPTGVPNYWPANTLPPNINEFFEPTQGANPNARVSRMLRDASFGNFEIFGDFYNNLITVNQSNINGLTESNVINNAIQQINTSIQNNSFSTGSNLMLTQFDLTRAKDEGLFANSTSNGEIDMVMYFFRNFPNGEGGWVSPGSYDPIDNMQSDLISVMNGADWQLIRHEFMHMIFGGNNFHCAGGQHNHPNTGSNYFGPLQNGFGLMGDERSSFMTCNAWDRDRLNWFHPNRVNEVQNDPNLTIIPNQHNIFCHNNTGINSSSIESDLDPTNPNDAGIYWLHDFMTTGDAIRIRLPFIEPANEFEQWLWIENHQTNARNNIFLDDFNHVGLGSNCKPNATPGLYAYVQIEKNVKESAVLNEVFEPIGDFLRFIPANGFHDYQEVGLGTECVYGDTWPIFNPFKSNPLSGTSELEQHISDDNNNNQINSSETKIFTIENNITSLIHQGHTRHAFTLTGNNKLGMGTNPSANNMLTEVSFDNAAPYGNTGIDNNRKVYLNGVSVEIIGEQANANNANMMDLQIRVRFDDVAIDQNVNYSADNIVLPNIVPNGPDLELAANKCIFIYHGTTPTKVGRIVNNQVQDSTTLYNGIHYFSQPTKFFIEPNANAHLNTGATIEVQDDSRLILRPNSSITLDAYAKIVVKDDATMILHPDAFIDFATGSYIEVKDNATLIINAGNEVELGGLPEVRVTGNGKLLIEDDATLQVASGGLIDIQQGATLEYQNSVAGKGLQFGAYGTAGGNEVELRMDGNLLVKLTQNFTFNGNGYLNFYPNNNLILPQGCSFNLTGQLAGGQDLIFKIQPNTTVSFNDAIVNLNQGKIEFGNLSQFQQTLGSLKLSNMFALGATANNAFLANQLSSVTISGSVFQDFSSGNSLNIQNSNIINLIGVTFNNCPYPLALSANNKTSLFSCNFNHPVGQGVEAIQISNQWPTYINSTQIENYQKAIYLDNAEGVYLNNSTLNNNNYGVYGFDSELFLRNNTAITNSTFNGVYLDSYAKYQGLLVMGDVGCATIANSSGSGIKGDDIEFSIDAVEHAFSGLNGGMVIPNRIYCNNPKNIDVCYKLQFDANNNYVVPSKVLGKGNFYKKDTESCTEVESPTNDDFHFAISPKCNLNTIPFDYSNYSLCNPPDGNCLACNPIGDLPLDRTWPSLRQSYTNAYAAFALKDTTTTRAAFVSLAAISLFKINEDVWSISIQGDTNDISDEDAAMIITAKCLYKDTSGLKSNKIRYTGAIDLFEVKTEDKNIINQNQTFSVYPNPTSQNFTIKTIGNSIINYRLLTINKTVIKQGAFKGETTINTTDLNAGIYLLQLNSFNATETRKIIIE